MSRNTVLYRSRRLFGLLAGQRYFELGTTGQLQGSSAGSGPGPRGPRVGCGIHTQWPTPRAGRTTFLITLVTTPGGGRW